MDAIEWTRQSLTLRMQRDDKQLARFQGKFEGDKELLQNLLLAAGEFESVHALRALRMLCMRNGAACARVCKASGLDVIRTHLNAGAACDERVRCSAAALADTLAKYNKECHRFFAKARLVPAMVQALEGTDRTSASYRDLLSMNVYDHITAALRNLSNNSAQKKLLIATGCVDVSLNLLASHDGATRLNAAFVVSNVIGRDEADSRMEEDPTIVEEVVAALEAALDDRIVDGQRLHARHVAQVVANLAANDANKKRIADAGALPLLVRVVMEPSDAFRDDAMFWGATGLWNLAFDEAIKEAIKREPGALDALAEARRTGSDGTKRKAKGALWMIEGADAEMEAVSAEEAAARLGGGGVVENAKGQVMLSYEWGQQQHVIRLRDSLMAEGFTVWMDVDRMMGSTLEAMAIAVEQSDAIVMCVTSRYKESQACRTEAEYAFTRKKPLIPVMLEKGYSPDGWLGIIMGSKLYYNMHTVDEMRDNLPGLLGEFKSLQIAAGKSVGAAPAAASEAPLDPSASAASAAPDVEAGPQRKKVTVPEDADAMMLWLDDRGLGRYATAFESAHLHGKALEQLHEEIGFHDPAEERYHDKFKTVLGMTSYGHRLLFLKELQELLGPIKWRR